MKYTEEIFKCFEQLEKRISALKDKIEVAPSEPGLEFKVGDRVEVIDRCSRYYGYIGIVSETPGTGIVTKPYTFFKVNFAEIDFKNGFVESIEEHSHFFLAWELKYISSGWEDLVTTESERERPEPKFKVGDKVKIKSQRDFIYEVTEVYDNLCSLLLLNRKPGDIIEITKDVPLYELVLVDWTDGQVKTQSQPEYKLGQCFTVSDDFSGLIVGDAKYCDDEDDYSYEIGFVDQITKELRFTFIFEKTILKMINLNNTTK